MKILVINGPNINMLGIREPGIYGKDNYNSLLEKIKVWADELNCETECFQSNHEGSIVDKIQEAYGNFDGIVINPYNISLDISFIDEFNIIIHESF